MYQEQTGIGIEANQQPWNTNGSGIIQNEVEGACGRQVVRAVVVRLAWDKDQVVMSQSFKEASKGIKLKQGDGWMVVKTDEALTRVEGEIRAMFECTKSNNQLHLHLQDGLGRDRDFVSDFTLEELECTGEVTVVCTARHHLHKVWAWYLPKGALLQAVGSHPGKVCVKEVQYDEERVLTHEENCKEKIREAMLVKLMRKKKKAYKELEDRESKDGEKAGVMEVQYDLEKVLLEIEGPKMEDLKGKKTKKKGKAPLLSGEEDIRGVQVKIKGSRKKQRSETKKTEKTKQEEPEPAKLNVKTEEGKLKHMLRNPEQEKQRTAKKKVGKEKYVEEERDAEGKAGSGAEREVGRGAGDEVGRTTKLEVGRGTEVKLGRDVAVEVAKGLEDELVRVNNNTSVNAADEVVAKTPKIVEENVEASDLKGR